MLPFYLSVNMCLSNIDVKWVNILWVWHKNGGIKTQIFDFNKEKDKADFESYNIQGHVLFKFDLYDNADFYIKDEQQTDLIKVNIIKAIF